MGCVKLHILDQQYKRTELRVSYINKKLTSNYCKKHTRSYLLYGSLIEALSWSSKKCNNRYFREGKEYLSDFGWNKLDFINRTFDPQIGRGLQIDPLAYKYYWISPYALWLNNPIRFIDPDGRGVFPSKEELRTAGTSAVNNSEYEKIQIGTNEKGKPIYQTFCNKGAQSINAASGDKSVQGDANAMGNYLRNPANATLITDQQQALDYANQGVVVFASYVSDGVTEKSGHIAVVAPTEGLTYSSQQGGNVVSVFNVGNDNGEKSLGGAFGERAVGLYILNSDLATINNSTLTYDGGVLPEVVISEQQKLMQRLPYQPIE